jgi:hypothetical protein
LQCSAVQCSAVQCSAVQCSAVQCSAVQCSAVQTSIEHPVHIAGSKVDRHVPGSPDEADWRLCSAVQCSAVQCSTVQCSAVQCSTVQCRLEAVCLFLRSAGLVMGWQEWCREPVFSFLMNVDLDVLMVQKWIFWMTRSRIQRRSHSMIIRKLTKSYLNPSYSRCMETNSAAGSAEGTETLSN